MFENERVYKQYIDGMDEYIQNLTRLQKEDPEQARKQAQASLKRSGILNKNGIMKKEICRQKEE